MHTLNTPSAAQFSPSFVRPWTKRPMPDKITPDKIQHAVRRELVAEVSREMLRVPTRQQEVSIESDDGQVALTLHGSAPERVLFSPSEARKLIAEIERALNRGFGRDMEAIRRGAA